MRRLAAVYGGSAPHHRALNEPKYARWLAHRVYLPDLPEADLTGYDGMVVPERLHAGRLHAARPRLLEMLERGGIIVLFGEQAVCAREPRGWLPGLDWEYRPTNYWWWLEPGATSGLRAHHPEHDLWRHLTLEDATWHQHGVYRAPPGADVLISTDDGGAILYIDRVSTPGTLLVAALDPMYHFGSYFMPATERFLDKFMPWLAEGEMTLTRRAATAQRRPMTRNAVDVLDQGTPISISFQDMLKYHGPGFPGGVAHALKVMERAFPLLDHEHPPERREIVIETAFRGPGARDAFEMVTRAVTGDRFVVDPALERTERGTTLERYVFALRYRGRAVTLIIREGYVTDEFIALSRKPGRTAEEEQHLAVLKQEMADRLTADPAVDVYDVDEAV